MVNPSNVTARRLSDAQLISSEFRYANPEITIPNLNRGVPDPEAHPTIIGYYDDTPPGGRRANPGALFVRCCHCGLRRHWRGHVIRDDQGQIYIIGASKCGREHYGIRYKQAEVAFKAEQTRQRALQRWRNARALVLTYQAEVAEILRSPTLTALEVKCEELRNASPEGFRKLVRIASTNDPMIEILEQRDHDAERDRQARYDRAVTAYYALPVEERIRRNSEGLKPELDTSPIYVRTSTPLGHLTGARYFIDKNDVRTLARTFSQTLGAIDAIDRRGTDSAKTTELTKLLREMHERPVALMNAIVEAGFTELFLKREILSDWSVGLKTKNISAIGVTALHLSWRTPPTVLGG
ncbi:hypothetical protein ACFS32_05565 [Novosphingobium pokkalii]|uniref:hypothetical protein n=1 Tax=Novosphingobium pokkalii TaxID=1770194 RepID=UPI0036349FBA